MSQAINAAPEGLLDLLGIKSGGRYPSGMSDEVVSVLPTWELYLAQRKVQIIESGLTLTGVASTVTAQVVPANEIWYVYAYMALVTLGAGVTAKIRVWASPYPATAGNSTDDGDCDNAASGTVGERIRAVKRNFWATSGTGFGINAVQNIGGPIGSVQANWVYVPLRR